jgi:hypothetical protein
MSRITQRGGGRFQAIFWLVVLAVLVYILIRVIPAFVTDYELKDFMESTARFGAIGNQGEDEIRATIWKKIQELEVPAQKEDLKVTKSARRVQISVEYTVEVPLPGYTMRLNFNPQADERGF